MSGRPGTSVRHNPYQVLGLVGMRQPEIVWKLILSIPVVNLMRVPLPNMIEVMSPLKVLVNKRLWGISPESMNCKDTSRPATCGVNYTY